MIRRSPNKWNEVPFGEIVSDSAFGPRFSALTMQLMETLQLLRTTDL